jgi:hypothetical protein
MSRCSLTSEAAAATAVAPAGPGSAHASTFRPQDAWSSKKHVTGSYEQQLTGKGRAATSVASAAEVQAVLRQQHV